MKRQIRRGVFETNSSSMHSIVVMKKSMKYSKDELRIGVHVRKNGELYLRNSNDLYFGKSPFEVLTTFIDKVKYATASLCGYRKDAEERFAEIENIVKEEIPEVRSVKLPHVWGSDDEVSYGGVDEDVLTGFLQDNGLTLKEFLINKRYYVVCDGDEYHVWDGMKNAGLIDSKKIEYEYR